MKKPTNHPLPKDQCQRIVGTTVKTRHQCTRKAKPGEIFCAWHTPIYGEPTTGEPTP